MGLVMDSLKKAYQEDYNANEGRIHRMARRVEALEKEEELNKKKAQQSAKGTSK